MNVITINGQFGSAALEIGAEVARRLQFDYVDRLILAEAAKRLGTTVEALVEKEQRVPSLGERIAKFLQTIMERSAASGAGGDPYFGGGIGILMGQEYQEVVGEPITAADQLEDEHFISATWSVIQDIANDGKAVIIGRAGNLILKDNPDAFHVGLVSTMESRIKVIAKRENLPDEEAERFANDYEKARVTFFKKFFGALPDDPANFHLMLNTHNLDVERVADIIIHAASA